MPIIWLRSSLGLRKRGKLHDGEVFDLLRCRRVCAIYRADEPAGEDLVLRRAEREYSRFGAFGFAGFGGIGLFVTGAKRVRKGLTLGGDGASDIRSLLAFLRVLTSGLETLVGGTCCEPCEVDGFKRTDSVT